MTNYNCPHCKTKKQPRKRYGGMYSDVEIFICDNCGNEFEYYELTASKSNDIINFKVDILEKQVKNKEITLEEFESKVADLMRSPF